MIKPSCAVFCFLFFLFSLSPISWAQPLRVRAIGDPQTLDWNLASTWVDSFIIRNIMEGLVAVDKNLKPKPALCRRWSANKNQTVYTFYLKPNVKWSDGVDLTAQHFIDSWERLLNPQTNAKYAFFLFDIKNATAYNQQKIKSFADVGVKALDRNTLQVTLEHPVSYWYFIPSFQATFPIRKDKIANYRSGWFDEKLVTVGPYVFKSYKSGKNLELEKNSYYSGTTGNVTAISYLLLSDDAEAVTAYKENKLDLLFKLSAREQRRVESHSDFRRWDDLRLVHLRMNVKTSPMQNLSLRKAIAHALDHKKMGAALDHNYEPASSFIPPKLLGFSKKQGLDFDLIRAKKHLKEYLTTQKAVPKLNLLTVAFEDQIITAQFIQDELKKHLNINVKNHILEPKRFYDKTMVHTDYDMQINFWGADFPDADNFLSVFLSNSGLNRYQWSNSTYDQLIQLARSEANPTKRNQYFTQAQKILLEQEVVTIPLYYGKIAGLVAKNVKGFDPGPMNWWHLKDLTIVH